MKTTGHSIAALLATLSAVPPGTLASLGAAGRNGFSTDRDSVARNEVAGRDVHCSDDDQVARIRAAH